MGKSIQKDQDKSKLKKKIQRQNTMEQTAGEAKEYLANYDKILKRQQQEKQQMKQKLQKLQNSKKVKKSTKKPTSPKKIKDTKAAVVPASPKKASPNKKKAAPAKIAASKPKTSKPKDEIKAVAPASVVSVNTFPSSIENDAKSCGLIAHTEVINNNKLGYQIIKKSIKGQAKAEDVTQKKVKPLRTKTGEKLAAGMIDVVFCCDTTSSMGSYINKCKDTVNQIIKNILDKTKDEGISVKFGFVAYRDHPPQDNTYLTCSYDLTTEDEIKQFIQTLSAQGGGDYPEAVMDGLYVSAKHMSWRDSTYIPSLRYIFHITDAPPHGQEYGSYSNNSCLCNIDINKLSHIINMRQIHYRLVSTGTSNLDKMAEIFKSKIVDYEECTINNASEMDIKISDMIIRELLPDMVEEEI